MRQAITTMIVLALGVTLYADNNASDKYGKDGAPVIRSFSDFRDPGSRTETYELYMIDSYGDGWNGASLDLYVNDVLVGDDLTIDDGSEASFEFDVEYYDQVHTEWTEGQWDGECAYAIYNEAGDLIVETGTSDADDLEVSFTVYPPAPDIFFSEYAEGSSNNKYLEIYNNTGADYDLSALSISSCSNGCDVTDAFDYPDNVVFAEGTVVAAGDVFVVAHPSADAAILAEADYTDFVYLSNGDDAFALTFAGATANEYYIIDIIGEMGGDPGDGWAVAGVENGTQDHTLQRNADVESGNLGDWASSAGTSADDSEWTVLDNEDWTGLGSHTVGVDCDFNELTVYMSDSYGDGWNGNVLTIGDEVFGEDFTTGTGDTASACLEDGSYAVTCDGGSYQTEVSWQIVDAAGTVLAEGGAPYEGVLILGEGEEVLGCTDATAINYDPDATFDDGSCYYDGDSCNIALDFVAAGGATDGSAPVEGSTTYAGDADWYHFTLDMAYENLMVSLVGSDFDTKLEVWGDCDDEGYLAENDDWDGLQSQVNMVDVAAGTYYAKVFGYSESFGNYVLTVDAFMTPTTPTLLSVQGGLERVYLGWEPSMPPGLGATNMTSSFDGTADEHIQWQYDNKKEPNLSGRGVPRSRLYESIENNGSPNYRDTDVVITLYDSYGDGFYGGDSDGDAWVLNSDGDTLHTLEGPWEGSSNAYGPFTLADGVYAVQWDETAPWLGEQSMEVTDASDSTIVYGFGAAPNACFALGEGYECGGPDLTITDMSYNHATGRATIEVANIGNQDAGYFYTMCFLNFPDTTELYPPGYFQYWWWAAGLAAGDTASASQDYYLTMPGYAGGYDDSTYTMYGYADAWGNYVLEVGGNYNNVDSMEVVNSNPLGNSTWNIYRSDGGADPTLAYNVDAPEWLPGGGPIYLTDEPLTADVEYCYHITQVNSDVETGPSDTLCATPSLPPDVPEPTDLTGSSSGFDVTLSWTTPEPYEGAAIILSGTPSSTRQGGDTVDDATVITELPASLEGTVVGYTDDYDCNDIGTSTSADVVYSITAETDAAIDLTLCYSSYDTKLFVFENEANNFAYTTTGEEACNDDGESDPGCTIFTSRIDGLSMTAGNTYYIVVDGWAGSEGDYVLDVTPYNPLVNYTIWAVDGLELSALGQAEGDANEWNTVLFAAEPTDVSLALTANYMIPGIFDVVVSEVVGPVTITVQIEDNPGNLVAMDYGDDVHLDWDPPIDASSMELAYDDGVVANAWWYAGAVAVRFRVSGTYAINGLTNSVWTGGWPDAYLGETPFTLSILAVDDETDLPGDTLYQEDVLVDADPTSDTYGWAMTSTLADNPVTVTDDVFIMYSDFGYDFENSAPGPDMDMMGCDAFLDFPGNKYSWNICEEGEWSLDIDCGALTCGDWILHMFADFTVGRGTVSFGGDGVWVDPSGSPSADELPLSMAMMEAVNTKENPVALLNPPVSDPIWPHQSLDREMTGYNVYRDGAMVGEQAPDTTEYWDEGLDWGTYTYHVTAQYDDHESMATNEVEVTLSNVAPDAVMLISPGDGLEVSVDSTNLETEVAFIWTAANDADNDPVEYWMIAGTIIDGDTIYVTVGLDSPLVTTGVFVTHDTLAAAAMEYGVPEITYNWDVFAYDGFEATPSSSGPREIHVDVSDMLGIDGENLPTVFALHNNYPNPFNPVTNINYDIPEVSDVTLEIYNVMGQRVRTLVQGSHEPGRYQIRWNATNDLGQGLSSGMYIYRIQANDFVSVKKLVLMK